MYVTLQELSRAGKAWEFNIPPVSLMDKDFGRVDALVDVCSHAKWHGVIQREYGLYALKGQWSLSLMRRCDRCMDDFEWYVQGDVQRSYVLEEVRDMDGEEQADVEVLPPPGLLNLMDVLREEVWLAWKPCVICKETCQGLCQSCGSNLNSQQCQCEGDHDDNPFAVLAKIKFDT
jgi:uncharacterized protein